MKRDILKNSLNLLVEITLIAFGIYGLYLNFFSTGFMGNGSMLLYFTIQSNIAILAIVIVFFALKIIQLITKKKLINNFLLHLKFVFTVGITITFLVFFILLAPSQQPSYLSSMTNLTVHCLVPIFALIDFFFFDTDIKFNKFSPLSGTIFPLLYLFFVLICTQVGVRFNGQFVPYFFLDFKTLGWFDISSKGIGVFYYILILLFFVILLCYLCMLIVYLVGKINNNPSVKRV